MQRTRNQYFDGKVTLKFLVVGAVNYTHTTGTDFLYDAIPPERLAYVWHP